MRQWGANSNPWVGYQKAVSPTRASPLTPRPGVEKSPFNIALKRLEIVQNVYRARLVRHVMALSLCQKLQMSERNMCGRLAA